MHSVRVHAPIQDIRQEPGRTLQEIADERLRQQLAAAFEAGRAEGLAAQLESGREALEGAAARLDAARQEAEDGLPQHVVELSVAIASELLAVELHEGNYDMERLVRGALASSGVGRGSCTVHVSQADAERLASVSFRAGTTIEADSSLTPGDIHVTTPRGLLVREMEPALDAIREQLLEELG